MTKTLLLILVSIFFLVNTNPVLAEINSGEPCGPSNPANPKEACIKDHCCKLESAMFKSYSCQPDPICAAFGKIEAPDPLKGFLAKDPTGAGAISNFLSRLVGLFFTLALIVALFMFLWAAVEWMTSGGEKEKVASARNKIIYSIIGIVLLATAFAIINIVGIFTGFTFFAGQK
jgi:hypothetical protein